MSYQTITVTPSFRTRALPLARMLWPRKRRKAPNFNVRATVINQKMDDFRPECPRMLQNGTL
jgi:hypothetical protein